MFSLVNEGQPVNVGFNFYRLSDRGSFGFKYVGKNRDYIFWFRYSKGTGNFIFGKQDLKNLKLPNTPL